MKHILKQAVCILSGALALAACQKQYEFNAEFSVPTELISPESVALDVTSPSPVVLEWTGGGAADGGIVLYEVLFDRENGDFSSPVSVSASDYGGLPALTLTHAGLNIIARNAGIRTSSTGRIKWTVRASKGGVVKESGLEKTISVTRGEGIDNIPSELWLYGDASENGSSGQAFRSMAEEGVFQIYTTIPKSGTIQFRSSADAGADVYFADATGKICEGEGSTSIQAMEDVARITVDFNSRSYKVDRIGKSVRCIWGATYSDIAVCQYTSGGKFSGEGRIVFMDPNNRAETNCPDWCSWIEERYYFIAKVNGNDVCWGRGDDVSAERPSDGEPASFYALYEYAWDQWEHLWKMKGSLDRTRATITIDTNADNLMIHTFTNVTSL